MRGIHHVPVDVGGFSIGSGGAAAHPGHGSDVLTGTLKTASEEAITLEFRDPATTALRRVRILVSDETKFRMGKEPIESPEAFVGTDATVVVDYEEDATGEIIYRAKEVRFRKPKD